jgi:hypothetical protein
VNGSIVAVIERPGAQSDGAHPIPLHGFVRAAAEGTLRTNSIA